LQDGSSSQSRTETDLSGIHKELHDCNSDPELLFVFLEKIALKLHQNSVLAVVKDVPAIPAALNLFRAGSYLTPTAQSGILRLMLSLPETFRLAMRFLHEMDEKVVQTIWPSLQCGFTKQGKDWLLRNSNVASSNHFELLSCHAATSGD